MPLDSRCAYPKRSQFRQNVIAIVEENKMYRVKRILLFGMCVVEGELWARREI